MNPYSVCENWYPIAKSLRSTHDFSMTFLSLLL